MEAFYDIIVVGGGHAGCEAAMAAGKLAAEGYFVFNLEGGYKAWTEAGKETEK